MPLALYASVMAITLTPEQEDMLRSDASACGFETAEAYLGARLEELHKEMAFHMEHREEFSRMIDEGLEELERGEFLSAEAAKEEREQMKLAYLSKPDAA